MDSDVKNYLPHGVTLHEFLEKLDPAELEQIQTNHREGISGNTGEANNRKRRVCERSYIQRYRCKCA